VALVARQVRPGEDLPVEERERRRERIRRLAPASRLILRGDATSIELRAVAATGGDDPLGHAIAARIAALVERPVAVSRPFRDAAERAPADAEARAALEAGDELAAFRDPPMVLRADRLGVYRVLGSVHNLPDGQRHARAVLEPLLAGSPRAQRIRLVTLRALLDGTSAAAAASALGIHRNTLAYRLRRIENLTGWDLADPELRLALSLALRFVQSP
jgi:DNA-binding PucR family transcriptional regulator